MSTIDVATSAADAQAVEAVKNHHAQLAGALGIQVEALVEAASAGDLAGAGVASDALVRWCEAELIPHALAEEQAMYPRAHEDVRARLLVDAMLDEHRAMVALVEAVRRAAGPVRAAASAQALRSLFDSHLVKENEQILPLLAASGGVSLAKILDGMHELLGSQDHAGQDHAGQDHAGQDHAEPGAVAGAETGGGVGRGCGCGHRGDETAAVLPELDARVVPHALRHAAIFGALDSLGAGGGMVLVAPHDPVPLLAQLEKRSPGLFDVDYLERGPAAWRVRLVRV